jgi:hypothetical protein
MTWMLRKPDVSLRVTRFAPAKPIAGLSVLQRSVLRLRRSRECRKIEPRRAPL